MPMAVAVAPVAVAVAVAGAEVGKVRKVRKAGKVGRAGKVGKVRKVSVKSRQSRRSPQSRDKVSAKSRERISSAPGNKGDKKLIHVRTCTATSGAGKFAVLGTRGPAQ